MAKKKLTNNEKKNIVNEAEKIINTDTLFSIVKIIKKHKIPYNDNGHCISSTLTNMPDTGFREIKNIIDKNNNRHEIIKYIDTEVEDEPVKIKYSNSERNILKRTKYEKGLKDANNISNSATEDDSSDFIDIPIKKNEINDTNKTKPIKKKKSHI